MGGLCCNPSHLERKSMNKQQNQALDYFRSNVADWQSKATTDVYNVIEDRHSAVKHAIKRHGNVKGFLDVGCGTGQLCIEVDALGTRSVGIDFAPEMIAKCVENAQSAGSKAEFKCASAFEAPFTNESFDAVSAQGFIEYITLEQLHDFLKVAHDILRVGGVLALGNRNRLFNVLSLNDYTMMEALLGTLGHLTEEAVLIEKAVSQEDAIQRLGKFEHSYGHPVSHPETGIKVDTRYQYSPSELVQKLVSFGFKVECLYPVNYHAFPSALLSDPGYKNMHLYMAASVRLHNYDVHQLLPFSSSFVISAIKI
jgi:SAM-dependent methyltransferase